VVKFERQSKRIHMNMRAWVWGVGVCGKVRRDERESRRVRCVVAMHSVWTHTLKKCTCLRKRRGEEGVERVGSAWREWRGDEVESKWRGVGEEKREWREKGLPEEVERRGRGGGRGEGARGHVTHSGLACWASACGAHANQVFTQVS